MQGTSAATFIIRTINRKDPSKMDANAQKTKKAQVKPKSIGKTKIPDPKTKKTNMDGRKQEQKDGEQLL